MMSLANRLEHYLTVRRRFRSGLSTGERELRQFAAFADAEDAAWITVELFLRWKQRFGSAGNATWSLRLGLVRGFAKWLHGIDPRTEIPPAGLIRVKTRSHGLISTPTTRSFRSWRKQRSFPRARGLRGLNFSTLFSGMLGRHGLRVSEAVGLDDPGMSILDKRVLAVRTARNRNSRAIPIHAPCTAQRLDALRAARNLDLRYRCYSLLRQRNGRRLTHSQLPVQLRGRSAIRSVFVNFRHRAGSATVPVFMI